MMDSTTADPDAPPQFRGHLGEDLRLDGDHHEPWQALGRLGHGAPGAA